MREGQPKSMNRRCRAGQTEDCFAKVVVVMVEVEEDEDEDEEAEGGGGKKYKKVQ